jgi:UDP-N-acetylmuramoyl-tripeptide--D-alanyl-D-alanine ligase
MVAAILRQRGRVLATEGNLNNHIGLPLMLARLDTEHDFAVFEMGANHIGEIAHLTAMAQPDVALINNAGPAHLEGFGDLNGVAQGKGEIYQGLGLDGIALINADDQYADYWRGLNTARRVIDFGFNPQAQVCGTVLPNNRLGIRLGEHSIKIALRLLGEHNQRNALAAAAAAWAVGVDKVAIQAGLESIQPVSGRLQTVSGVQGCTLINDTYNANPASLLAGLRALPAASERWLVLGDMAELGATSTALHEQVGRDIRALGIKRLFTLGELSFHTSQAFGAGSAHFTELGELTNAVQAALAVQEHSPPVVLVKGSRSMRMEQFVTLLQAKESVPC